MTIKSKPIQATPVLSGIDAKRIIEQVNKIPSKDELTKIKEKLRLRKLNIIR